MHNLLITYVHHIPTKKRKTKEGPRFSCSTNEQGWPKRHQAPSPQGPCSFVRLVMLPRKARIDTKTFKEVFPKGHSLFAKNISVRVIHREDGKDAQFAVIVSKKINNRATKRNSMRRKIYAVLGEIAHIQTIKPAYYIFMVQKPIGTLSHIELVHEIDFLLKSVKI